jgi:hypothetical protein
MTSRIISLGGRVSLSGPSGNGALDLIPDVLALWSDWAERYRTASGPMTSATLLAIGREMFEWLDAGGWASGWAQTAGPRVLEIGADADPTEEQCALLDLPWELLADKIGHLAVDSMQPYEVWRRLGVAAASSPPAHRDLSLLFMAASPRDGGPELDYEAEETAILSATERLGLSLSVEESGCLEFLSERLDGEEAFEAIHLSGHGEVLDAEDAKRLAALGAEPGPTLLLETPEGGCAFASPRRLAQAWGGHAPKLIFLSACRTAQATENSASTFARTLVRAVPSVLGWDGKVFDTDAIAFTESFYRALAAFETPAFAAAAARRTLLQSFLKDGKAGSDWHLARVYLGAGGGGPLCARARPRRKLPQNAGFQAFLDKDRSRVPVAGARAFVGRRREAQAALRAFRCDEAPGLLLQGMGNLGKSSLAARIANRLPNRRTVVAFHNYDPAAMLQQIIAALPPADRQAVFDRWNPALAQRPAALADALEELLEGPFHDHPILLIIDDLEQVLEAPAPGAAATLVKQANGWRASIVAVLTAFEKARGDSRLLITCSATIKVRIQRQSG